MSLPDVWYAIPSANPDLCRKHLSRWREMGYKVAVLQNRVRADIPADIVRWSETYPGWAESINILTREVVPKSAQIIVSGGDDMLPDPTLTAQEIGKQFLERFPDTFGVMQPHGDTFLNATQYCGSPWLGRAWCQRMYGGTGGLFGGYRHNWADNELYWVSRCMNRLWVREDLSQHHAHFTRESQSPEEYWIKNVSLSDKDDVQLFIARSWQLFPGHEPAGFMDNIHFDRSIFQSEYSRQPEAYWASRYGPADTTSEAVKLCMDAMNACKRDGIRSVAIFGAGTHTRALGSVLMNPDIRVLCIIDENPMLQGQRLWNYPIVSMAEALEYRPDAVILSSKMMENELARSCEELMLRGTRVVRLYTQEAMVA